jgi:glycosyltransferase involved in cell wall biosynthesis
MPSPNVAVMIPAFREAAFIGQLASQILAQRLPLLVVDDGSDDATAANARAAGAEVLRHEINRGKGAALKSGFQTLHERGFDWVLAMDGDGQHLAAEIPRFLEKAADGRDAIVIGNRLHDPRGMPPVRLATNRFMSWVVSQAAGQPIPDSQCGFRMVRRDVIPHLLTGGDHFDYETSMLLHARRLGFTVGAVQITTVYGDETSKIRPLQDTLRWIKLLWRERSARG